MKHPFILISDNPNVNQIVEGTLEDVNATLKYSTPSQLLTDIYTINPKGLIIYYDTLSSDAIETINSAIHIIYTPNVTILGNKGLKNAHHPIVDTTPLYLETLETILPSLLSQMTTFSRRYSMIANQYDIQVTMYEEAHQLLEAYLSLNNEYSLGVLRDYYHRIFYDTPFIMNRPSQVIMLKDLTELQKTEVTFLSHPSIGDLDSTYVIDTDLSTYLSKTRDTGFLVNLNNQGLSDIDDLNSVIPKALLDTHQPKHNLTVSSVEQIMLICYDYNQDVTQGQLEIIRIFNAYLSFLVSLKSHISEVQDAFYYTMDALARAAEAKDDVTGFHIKRVNAFSKALAIQMHMDNAFVNEIEIAAQMHDVGKIKVPEAILNKPGKLTDAEFEVIKEHTIYGEDIIGQSSKLSMAKQIARYHHEKFDGSGYPDGLVGESIPIEARIVALADIYDALRSPRSYKPGFSHQASYDIITSGDGRVEPRHFDPEVLEAFKIIHKTFQVIYDTHQDQ